MILPVSPETSWLIRGGAASTALLSVPVIAVVVWMIFWLLRVWFTNRFKRDATDRKPLQRGYSNRRTSTHDLRGSRIGRRKHEGSGVDHPVGVELRRGHRAEPQAIASYRRSVELDPNNRNAVKALKKLNGR